MSDDNSGPRKLRIQPPRGNKWFTIWEGTTLRAMADSEGEAKAALAFLQTNIDGGRHPLSAASVGHLALARVDMLSAEVKALRDEQVRPTRRGPPPSPETLEGAYKNAKAAGCKNRKTQDKFVEDIYGALPRKMKEDARRAAGVGGKPGPEPGTHRRPKKP
jgi:hypothetical protein